MKKLLIGLIALIPFLKSSAQSAGNDTTQYIYYRFTYGNALDRYWAKKVLLIPGDTIYSKDGIALKGGTLYLGDGTKWNQVAGGAGTDSAVAAQYGIKIDNSTATRYFKVDSFAVESRQRGLKIADSLRGIIDSTRSRINVDLFTKKDKSDSIGSTTGYVTQYQADSMRKALYYQIGQRVLNGANAKKITVNPFLMRPAASNCQCFWAAPDSLRWSYDDGTWHDFGGGSGSVAAFDSLTTQGGVFHTEAFNDARYVNKANTDVGRFPEIRQLYYGAGITNSGTTVTNYGIGNLDSSFQYYSTLNWFPLGGTKYGGILFNSTVGTDSFMIRAPFWVLLGSSFLESHVLKHGRLHPNGVNGFKYDYPDSAGNFGWFMDSLTNMRFYNQSIGGQSTTEELLRWMRDGFGDSVSSTLDGRYGKTISGRPYGIMCDGAGNDPYKSGMTPEQTINNLRMMAAICQDYGVKFVICNSPSGAGPSAAGELYLQQVNKALESGVLEQYGAVVYDLRKFWSDPAWGVSNGVHGNPALVNGTDGTHFTEAGERALAINVYNTCRIPKLTKAIFSSAIGPTNAIANFNYISTFEIDGKSYTVHAPIDSFDITQPFGQDPRRIYSPGDSIWIKPTAVTNVVGTSGTPWGVGNIAFVLDNTAGGADVGHYTRKVMGMEGATAAKPTFTAMGIRPMNNLAPGPAFWMAGNTGSLDPTTFHVWANPTGSGLRWVFNNGSTVLNNSIVTIGGGATAVGLDIAGYLRAEGTNASQINGIEIGGSGLGASLGNAITHPNNRMFLQTGTGASTSGDGFTFSWLGSTTPTISTSFKSIGFFASDIGFGIFGDGDSGWIHRHTLPLNQTATMVRGHVGFAHYNYKFVTSDKNLYKDGFWVENGTNTWNTDKTDPGKFGIGEIYENLAGSAMLDVVDTTRCFIPPRMNNAQRKKVGYISSVTITQGTGYANATIAITGGTGSGARFWIAGSGASLTTGPLDVGRGYDPTVPVTVTIGGTAGSGATGVATIHGPDRGDIIYNTDVDSLQVWNGTTWMDLGGGGGGSSNPFADNTALVKNNSDNTKLLKFSAASISTATTRTWTAPDYDGILAAVNHGQSFTGAQDFTGATITVPTQSPADNSTKAASTAYVDAAVAAGSGATDITVTRNATNVTIASSTGTDGTLSPADATHAGALDTARAKFIDSLKNRQVANDQNVGAIGSGRELLVTRNDSLLHRTITVNGQAPDTASNGTVLINTGANFAQIADGTVTNSAGNLSILGTGRGSNTFAANSLVVGSRVAYKGFGVISTAGTAPTLSMSFANSSSNVSASLSSLLTTSMSSVPMEWEGYAIVRSTGGSGSIQINGWVSIGGTKAYISGVVTFNTTASQTFDVFAQFGTASTSNTIVSYQNYITMTP